MRNALLSSFFVLTLSGVVSAMPVSPPPKDTETVTCPSPWAAGPGWTRGPYGLSFLKARRNR